MTHIPLPAGILDEPVPKRFSNWERFTVDEGALYNVSNGRIMSVILTLAMFFTDSPFAPTIVLTFCIVNVLALLALPVVCLRIARIGDR
jgi:hypothetical protein